MKAHQELCKASYAILTKNLFAKSAETSEVVLHSFKRVWSASSGQVVYCLRDEFLVHHMDGGAPADGAGEFCGAGGRVVSHRSFGK